LIFKKEGGRFRERVSLLINVETMESPHFLPILFIFIVI
jgi:hypothetical protein